MTDKKHSPKDIIKKALWYRGYKVCDVANTGIGYDLLVEGKHKVKVLASKATGHVVARNCDILAVIEGKKKMFSRASSEAGDHGSIFSEWISNPIKLMGRPASRKTGVDEAETKTKL